MIYFLQPENESLVKIGYTSNPRLRMSDHQVSNPHKLIMLLLIDGSRKDEKALHNKFVDDKYRAEWFYLSDDIKEFIKSQHDHDKRYDEGLHRELDERVQTKYIRTLHSLNLREMGEKLGMTPQSVKEAEYRELQGTLSIKKLQEYGKALGYELVYKFVKKDEE